MITTGQLVIGRKVGQVAYVRDVQSDKLKMYSTIVQFWKEIDGEFGKTKATEGYFGIAMTTEKPDLKPGEYVNVEIVSYQSGVNPNDPTGRENLQARCLLISRAAAPTPIRVEAAKPAVSATA